MGGSGGGGASGGFFLFTRNRYLGVRFLVVVFLSYYFIPLNTQRKQIESIGLPSRSVRKIQPTMLWLSIGIWWASVGGVTEDSGWGEGGGGGGRRWRSVRGRGREGEGG